MPTPERLEKINRVAGSRLEGILVLEDIYDPHNAEAVFRSCDAFGIQTVYLVFDKQKPFNPKGIGKSTSSSANKWLDFKSFSSITECYNDLHHNGYQTLATVISDDAEPLCNTSLIQTPKTAIVLGNEHRGLSEEAMQSATRRITIPMQGMVQSLNLSVTASICLHELYRQRVMDGIEKYALANAEQRVQDFCDR